MKAGFIILILEMESNNNIVKLLTLLNTCFKEMQGEKRVNDRERVMQLVPFFEVYAVCVSIFEIKCFPALSRYFGLFIVFQKALDNKQFYDSPRIATLKPVRQKAHSINVGLSEQLHLIDVPE